MRLYTLCESREGQIHEERLRTQHGARHEATEEICKANRLVFYPKSQKRRRIHAREEEKGGVNPDRRFGL